MTSSKHAVRASRRSRAPDPLAWVAAGLAALFCALEAWLGRLSLAHAAGAALAVGAPAVAAAWLAGRRGGAWPLRLAPAWLLAALVLLPRPAVLLITLSALIAGRGGGISGPHRAGPARVAPVVLAATLASLIVERVGVAPVAGGLPGLVGLLLVAFATLQLVPFALWPATEGSRWSALRVPDAQARSLGAELIAVPLALALIELVARGAWLPYGALSLTALAAAHLERTHRTAREAIRRVEQTLGQREQAIEGLRTLGIDIASSRDPSRILALVERECATMFGHDFFMVALADPADSALRAVFRRRRGEPPQLEPLTLGQGLASWVMESRRPLMIEDVPEAPGPCPVHLVAEDARAVLFAPLLVEDRAIGVLSVQSRRPRAWDERRAESLRAVAQLAALGIDNARHHAKATHDALTGFHLRDYFFRRVEDEYRRVRRYGGRFAVLMMDLDGFKAINDRNGHLAGDRYLAALGKVVRGMLRGADLACRYGGDEFCLLLPETDLAGARAIGERLRAAVARMTVRVDRIALRATVSIGVASYPEHDTGTLADLLRRADEALYRAKRTGRDRVVPYAA